MPLLLATEKIDWGPKPFRYLNTWFSHPQFKKMVEGKWKSMGNTDFAEKLKSLKGPLRKWNSEVFGDIDHTISKLEEELAVVDRSL